MSGQHYCLRWNNYQSNMTSVFHQLLQNEAFVDVTLACNDLSLKAHKVVLSACSSYFQKLLLENPCKHPTIIMPQDVCYADLKFIIEFVYKGEIDVSQTELQSLLRTADQLKIKGLCEPPDEKENSPIEPQYFPKNFSKVRKSSSPKQFKPQDNNKRYKHKKPHLDNTSDKEDNGSIEAHSSDEEHDMPVALNDHKRKRAEPEQVKPLNMSSHGILTGQTIFSQFGVDTDDFPPEPPAPSAIPVGHVDMQDHSPTRTLLTNTIHRTDLSDSNVKYCDIKKEADIKFETLRSYDQDSLLEMDSHMSGPDHSMDSHEDDQSMHQMMVTPELMGMMPGVSNRLELSSNEVPALKNNGHSDSVHHTPRSHGGGPKTWTQEDMDMALDALRNHNMSLTKASATYGIPSTTLWQRAHRLGIDTPKKEGPTKSWTEENLNSALEALRTGTISANKASKAYGIPSSTLYKIARREGIRLAAPFNAAPTTWTPEDLEKALESIRSGQTSVQKASTEFGIPTGTLYGRCKREGIELSRSNPTPWSEDAMGEALEAVRLGHMSINQAAIHYNLPYSSLYGRFKRGIKYESDNIEPNSDSQSQMDGHSYGMDYANTHQQIQYQNQTNS
ncbi:protein tramtrack, alpha isoform-like isoform X1 [Tribolium madens]|uniref:protein tramtrack, alpha isoform-like isoform X1 n=1 Tax=Tribolium madens TaxID=41895 RepID=UPI001CF75323|nr:protein tramtrack, alpha isoform-like isoform X1 [Tribolium madens]XP_044269035.1 protein tramtrack, alpha isoform-like isoform X1 [Tribolium madens]